MKNMKNSEKNLREQRKNKEVMEVIRRDKEKIIVGMDEMNNKLEKKNEKKSEEFHKEADK